MRCSSAGTRLICVRPSVSSRVRDVSLAVANIVQRFGEGMLTIDARRAIARPAADRGRSHCLQGRSAAAIRARHAETTKPALPGGFRLLQRRGRDLNPRSAVKTDNGFRDRRIRPLCHLSSAAKGYPHRRGNRPRMRLRLSQARRFAAARPSCASERGSCCGSRAAAACLAGATRTRWRSGRRAVLRSGRARA